MQDKQMSIANQLKEKIKIRRFKPLNRYFIEAEKLCQKISENDICNKLLQSMAPNVISVVDSQEVVNYK